MLHIETIEPNTFSILKTIISLPEFSKFNLVGGTALALLFGHRKSDDLDLFSTEQFEHQSILDCLKIQFRNKLHFEQSNSSIGIFCYIDSIKIDLIPYLLPLIKPLQWIDGIRMLSTEDLAAMKIQAILGRGKKKIFWDIAALLN